MAESERNTINDADELEKLFKPEITGGVISDKFEMPKPDTDGKVVRFLYIKGKDGKLGVVDKVKNPKFKGDGEAEFMRVEEIGKEGLEKTLGLSESMKNGLRRVMNEEHWKAVDIPGKVVHITANWWFNATVDKRDAKNKCVECKGTGCKFCSMTGLMPPVVFNVRARHDLMSVVGKNDGVKKGDEF